MADPSNFWKMVDRTKPSKLHVFGESELRDCLDYFSEIQSNSTLAPNEILTASERLILIRSEIDVRHADARHRRTQRLAGWAIAVGMVAIAGAIISGIVQYSIYKPTHDNWPAAIETPIVATPTPTESTTPTRALAATLPTATPDSTATPTPRPTVTEQRHKKRRTRPETKTKTDQGGSIEQHFRSLFRPKPTPTPDRR
jgi:hypothetical protein